MEEMSPAIGSGASALWLWGRGLGSFLGSMTWITLRPPRSRAAYGGTPALIPLSLLEAHSESRYPGRRRARGARRGDRGAPPRPEPARWPRRSSATRRRTSGGCRCRGGDGGRLPAGEPPARRRAGFRRRGAAGSALRRARAPRSRRGPPSGPRPAVIRRRIGRRRGRPARPGASSAASSRARPGRRRSPMAHPLSMLARPDGAAVRLLRRGLRRAAPLPDRLRGRDAARALSLAGETMPASAGAAAEGYHEPDPCRAADSPRPWPRPEPTPGSCSTSTGSIRWRGGCWGSGG